MTIPGGSNIAPNVGHNLLPSGMLLSNRFQLIVVGLW
jgi:hypothetical protein